MSAQSSGRTPRSSTSSQPSASSSSSPVAQKSLEPGTFDGSLSQRKEAVGLGGGTSSNTGTAADDQRRSLEADELHDERQSQRQKPRHSGGFLLQRLAPSHAAKKAASDASSMDTAKGKRKAEGGELVVPKRALGHHQPKAVGSSPLTSEITPGPNGVDAESPSISRQSVHSNTSEKMGSTGSHHSPSLGRGSYQKASLGQNTDPAEIINLALSLSESRRRNISGASMLVPREAADGRRSVSATQQTLGIPYGTSGGSLRQYMRDQRRSSRNISPRSSAIANGAGGGSSPQPLKSNHRQSSGSMILQRDVGEDVVFRASDATFARAEKARATLELGYEHRRLLQYLPALPQSLPNTGKGAERGASQETPALGRAYNPLQYVRNRKLRLRDKKPLNSELDGWKDVDRVRSWVDAIKNEREVGISRVDDRFPLPRFEAVADQPMVVDSAEPFDIAQPKKHLIGQPMRPTIDWTFTPSDLIADVYWMNQDYNVERIEDRHWQKLIRTPKSNKHGSSKTAQLSPTSPVIRKSASLTRHGKEQAGDLDGEADHEAHERGRRRKGHHEAKSSTDLEDVLQTRKSRWPKKFLRSQSSSSGSQSDWSNRSRHRRRRGSSTQNHPDNATLEKHMLEMLAQEAEESKSPPKAMNGQVKHSSHVDSDLHRNKRTQEAKYHGQSPHRPKTDVPSAPSSLPSARQSLDVEGQHRRKSSEDLRTAPTSPLVPGLAPSIAVDRSPPQSPPKPTTHPTLSPLKRPFASRLESFRRDRSRSVGIRPASEIATSNDSGSSTAVSRQTTNDPHLNDRLMKQQSTDHLNGSLGLQRYDPLTMKTRPLDAKSSRLSKDPNNPDSKLRGLFKGGRIAELVGTEVSKVGDILWRKDGIHQPSQLASPMTSDPNSDASDQDDQDLHEKESSPSENLSRATTNVDSSTTRLLKATNGGPKYHMDNLPTFRSRFADVDQSSTLAAPLPDEDHIARQQRMMKQGVRSSKFDRLAPPKMDMRSVSPSPSLEASRSRSRNLATDQSRDSSGSRSTRGVRNADRKLNDMLGIPGRVGTGKVAPTGLAALSSHAAGQRARGRPNVQRQWSISDRGISAVRGTITKRDIARVRALLLSSGIKAGEIFRRNDETPAKPSILLQGLQDVIQDPIPLIPPSQEFVFAARALVADIEGTHKRLSDAAEGFSKDIVGEIHNRIRAVDERVNSNLTPLVRSAADNADAFSAELTTTHTLAIRQLNDSMDSILRKRRRRLRWVGSVGWAMLEWTVLGVMWMVWFIVVIVRVLRGTAAAIISAVRWLLFL